MSKPITETEMNDKSTGELLRAVFNELHSARSALNMQPKLKDGQSYDNGGYLSNVDQWAEHAYDHVTAAIETLIKYNLDMAFKKGE